MRQFSRSSISACTSSSSSISVNIIFAIAFSSLIVSASFNREKSTSLVGPLLGASTVSLIHCSTNFFVTLSGEGSDFIFRFLQTLRHTRHLTSTLSYALLIVMNWNTYQQVEISLKLSHLLLRVQTALSNLYLERFQYRNF